MSSCTPQKQPPARMARSSVIGILHNGLSFRAFNCHSMRLERCTQIGRAERPVRCPRFPQVDADVDVVENALLALEWPQDATVQQARRNGLELAPAVETTVGVNRQFS